MVQWIAPFVQWIAPFVQWIARMVQFLESYPQGKIQSWRGFMAICEFRLKEFYKEKLIKELKEPNRTRKFQKVCLCVFRWFCFAFVRERRLLGDGL